ncbi:Uncharacterised protein [Yersinia enterocolitica]|nr:Uncharacterised protein [Yersinia enterocolitica]
MASFAFFCGDLALNHHLGRDTSMVSPGLPQGIFALHTLITNQGIHDGLLERMAHVQATGDVRRRDHDAVAFFTGIAVRLEITLFFPVFIQRLFDFLRAVCFIEGRLSFVDIRRCVFHFLFYFN